MFKKNGPNKMHKKLLIIWICISDMGEKYCICISVFPKH